MSDDAIVNVNLFSFDFNTNDFNELTSFKSVYKMSSLTEQSVRLVNSDIKHDSALSIVYNRLKDIIYIRNAYEHLSEKCDDSKLQLSSSAMFSFPAGFEVHHCAVSANGTTNLDTRSNYSPDRIQQGTISSMYSMMIQPNDAENGEIAISQLPSFDTFSSLLNSTYDKISINEILPHRDVMSRGIITSGSIQTFLLEFASILEKLKLLKCNCYYKQTVFDGKILFYNTVNVYPELPAVSDSSNNSYYSAVLASPLARYFYVAIEQSQFLKRLFTIETATRVNQIASNQLIYVGFDYKNYSSFQLDTFDGTNGKADLFVNISTSTYDIKSQIPDILSMFSLSSGDVLSLKKMRQALLYILDIWERNIKMFQIDIYACHFNCHLNNVTDPVISEPLIQNYFYTITHNVDINSFPVGLRGVVSISGDKTTYKFASSAPTPRDETKYAGANDRVGIVMSYPIYTGNDLNVQIPVKVKCTVTNIYGDATEGNTKQIIFTNLYYVTRNNITESLYVQDQGLNSSGSVVPGKDIQSPITARNFAAVNNTISCVGDIMFDFTYYSGKITKNYFLENGNVKNSVNWTTDEKIVPGYIYDIRGNENLRNKPSFINMANRKVDGKQLDYATSYKPSLIRNNVEVEENPITHEKKLVFKDNGELSVFFHYPSSKIHEVDDPDYYTRLSNYIRLKRDTEGVVIGSEQIPDNEAWELVGGNPALKTDVYEQFMCSYENSTTVTENAIVSIFPIDESEFGGSLTAQYQIKQLPKLSFNDSNVIAIDWDAMTEAVIDDYTQGNGPFEPTVDVMEKTSDGDEIVVNEPDAMYKISYENNNPSTYKMQSMTVNVSPTTAADNGYGDVFYIGDVYQLYCNLKPMPSDSSGIAVGQYQFNMASSNRKEIVDDPDQYWTYGAVLDWDEAGETKGGYGYSQYLIERDGKSGYKPTYDKDDGRNRLFETSVTIPADVTYLTIKYAVSRPWDDSVAVVGSVAVMVNGATVWMDVYNTYLKSHAASTEGYKLQYYESSTTVKISPPEGSDESTLGVKCSVLAPNQKSARFVAIGVWYDSEETRLQKELEAALARVIYFKYEYAQDKSVIADYDTWVALSDMGQLRTYQEKPPARSGQTISRCITTSIGAQQISTKFSTIGRVSYKYNKNGKTVTSYNVGWRIKIESSNSAYSAEYIVKYADFDKSKKTTNINWSPAPDNIWYNSSKRQFIDALNSIKTTYGIRLYPLIEEDFDNAVTIEYTVSSADGWTNLPAQSAFDTKTKLFNIRQTDSWPLIQSTYSINNDMNANIAAPSTVLRYCKKYTVYLGSNGSVYNAYGSYSNTTDQFSTLTVTRSPQLTADTETRFSSMFITPEKDPMHNTVRLWNGTYPNPIDFDGIVWDSNIPDSPNWKKTKEGLSTGKYTLPRASYRYKGNGPYYCIGWKAEGYVNETLKDTIDEIEYTKFNKDSDNTSIITSTGIFPHASSLTKIVMTPILSYVEKSLKCTSPKPSGDGIPWTYEYQDPTYLFLTDLEHVVNSDFNISRAHYSTWINADAGVEGHLQTVYNIGWEATFTINGTSYAIDLIYSDGWNSASSELSIESTAELLERFDTWQKRRDASTTFTLKVIRDPTSPKYQPQPEPAPDPEPEP